MKGYKSEKQKLRREISKLQAERRKEMELERLKDQRFKLKYGKKIAVVKRFGRGFAKMGKGVVKGGERVLHGLDEMGAKERGGSPVRVKKVKKKKRRSGGSSGIIPNYDHIFN